MIIGVGVVVDGEISNMNRKLRHSLHYWKQKRLGVLEKLLINPDNQHLLKAFEVYNNKILGLKVLRQYDDLDSFGKIIN